MASLLSDPKLWVSAAFVIFVALTYRKIGGFVVRGLDERTAKIKAELDRARQLREEAEAVLADYRRKQAEYAQETQAMLEKARRDADLLTRQAEKDLREALDARMRQAMDKIAREEARAVQEVREHVVDIAMSAARAVIVNQTGKLSQDELFKLALADIERKIH